jgi:hypothetical protein
LDQKGGSAVRRLSAFVAVVSVAFAAIATSGPAGASPIRIAKAHVLKSSRLTIILDPIDPERVLDLTWTDGTGTRTGNLVAEGGGGPCGDPVEFFGQSYGAPEGTPPGPVVAGHRAKFAGTKTSGTVTGKPKDCLGNPEMPVSTTWTMFSGTQASEARIGRTLGFDKTTPIFNDVGVRPYVPRLHLGDFIDVIVPNGANNAVTTVNAGGCGGDCLIAKGDTWNGKWFADIDPANGYAMIVRRDPAMRSPVDMTINNDSLSGSNLSSFVLLQPGNGWNKPVTEVEYLCFEDLKSWPQAKRNHAKLPAGCGP